MIAGPPGRVSLVIGLRLCENAWQSILMSARIAFQCCQLPLLSVIENLQSACRARRRGFQTCQSGAIRLQTSATVSAPSAGLSAQLSFCAIQLCC